MEAQKKADAIQLWWAERQRLGYDAYNGDESPSPSPELPVRRPRSMSLSAEMRGDEGDADDGLVEVPTDLPSGRRRSRANFSAADIEERARFPGEEGTAVVATTGSRGQGSQCQSCAGRCPVSGLCSFVSSGRHSPAVCIGTNLSQEDRNSSTSL